MKQSLVRLEGYGSVRFRASVTVRFAFGYVLLFRQNNVTASLDHRSWNSDTRFRSYKKHML